MTNQAEFNQTLFNVGDTVKVYQKITEQTKDGLKTRSQIFQGIVIAIRGSKENKSFIVRRISSGIGVERIWPINCPSLSNIVVTKKGKVKRAKLYYLRRRIGKEASRVAEQKPS